MYKVIEINDEICYSERTVFRSAVLGDCWNFIQRRLVHPSLAIRAGATNMFVVDGTGAMIDPPYEVNVLRKAA